MNFTLQDKPILMYDSIFKAIVANEQDTRLLDYILSDILEEKVHVIEFIPTELKIRRKSERIKVTDLIVESNNGKHILVELNSNFNTSTKLRNLSYYTSYYSQIIERGYEYNEDLDTVLINLNQDSRDKLSKKTYLITCLEDDSIYTNTFKIINVNLVKYKELWYDECIKGNKKHIHLVMLNANMDEIKELGKKDKVVKEYEDKMLTLTKDGVVINHLSYEEEQEKLRRSDIHEARDEGISEGITKGIAEEKENIAINMLKDNMPINIIMKYTSLTEKEIEKLKNNLK